MWVNTGAVYAVGAASDPQQHNERPEPILTFSAIDTSAYDVPDLR